MTPYDKTYSYEVLWQQPRKWGYEISVGIYQDKAFVDNLLITYSKQPDEKELSLDLIRRVEQWLNRPPMPAEDKAYRESEIVELLVSKGYLTEGDKLSDLPVKEISHG